MTKDQIRELKNKFNSQTNDIEAYELYNCVLNSPDGDVVEVGSASGGTTIILIHAAKERNKFVYSVDPYPEELEYIFIYKEGIMKSLKKQFQENILNGDHTNIVQFNEDTLKCIDRIPDKLSLVFIDGCHELQNVQNEIELLFPKIISDGYLFVHDTNWEIGQLSGKADGALKNIYEWIKAFPVKNITKIDTMLRCQKI